MSSTTHPKFFQRGRINARDLIKQDLEFIQDYATRYSISKTLAAEEIVHKIFESRQEFIPILPNHTWALEDDRIVLTERREPPVYPRYQSLPSNPPSLGDAFPEPPEDTFSRSPSPSSEEHIEERPSRLPLVYPPVGLGDQPVPDDWLQQIFEEYQENHETVVSELEKLVEEIKTISYETVRAMSKVRKEQSHTWHLLDTVKEVCGSEFVDKLLRDIHATTRFEINRKLRASGIPSDTVLPTADDEHGGTIRSKKFTRDKQIFGMTGGSTLPLHEGPGPSQPSNSQLGAASSMGPLVDASIPEKISAAAATRPSAPPKSSQSAAESTVNQVTEPSESAVAAPNLRRSTRNKRSRAISTDNPSEDLASATLRSKRRKASPPVDVRPVPQESTSNAVPPTSTPPVIPVVASSSIEGPSLSSQRVQRPDSFDLWGPRSRFQDQILEASAATSNPAQAVASSSDPSTTSNQTRPEEPFNLWTARFPMGARREHDLIPSRPSSSQVGFSQPSDVDSLGPSSPAQIASFGLGQSAATSLDQPTTSSSQPAATAFSQPAMSPSQPTAGSSSQPTTNSGQPTADSSQPSQPRRPAPLRRTNERLVINSDGTLEIINLTSLSQLAAPAFSQPATGPSQPTASSSQPTTNSSQQATSSSQPTTDSSQQATSSSQQATSSSQPTTDSSQQATSSSQQATSSSQPTADSSQPSPPRRPAPLRRTNERLVMNSDGTLEIINYDTPERIAEGEEIVRDAQRRGHRYTLSQISELCAPRYPFLFAGKSEDSYHAICPPSPRAGW
ncbi:hypothetical protein GGU11DRAFT_754941 [Lentinula aff. detonsa]|nr:hypothetical protein GGU11DRAFT_754941 [Lentinula aff. detonsa]